MAAKLNCWEAMDCGREPEGSSVAELGVCPAAADKSSNGTNGGINGGRICWAIAGTFCGGRVQGTRAKKRLTCLNCEFFERVSREEESSFFLPTQVTDVNTRRLTIAAVVVATVWVIYAILYATIWFDVVGPLVPIAAAIVIAFSVGFVVCLRQRSLTLPALVALAFTYEVLQALALSVLELARFDPITVSGQVSWTCVLIIFFPMLVPATPRATLVASMIAAAMGPLVYFLGVALGAQVLGTTAVLVSRFLPLFVSVGLAYVGSRVVHGLAVDLKRARRLGSYELVARIGKGGMGEVWRARHHMLARPAAIKLIRPEVGDIERLRIRFEREAQATAALESPHTVELYDYGVSDDGAFYYVMELLRGVELETLIRRFGPLPAERVVHLLLQACDSFLDAQKIGLVHRDIKPSNLSVGIRGQRYDYLKVLDFGLVKLDSVGANLTATADGILLGTPAYMAPETVDGSGPLDGRADVYALGCVAYWMLTGQVVFDERTPMAVAVAHVREKPVPPSKRTENPIPPALEEVIMACLEKKVDERPDAGRLTQMLEDCPLDAVWSKARAEQWWRAHLPDIVSGAQWSDHSEERANGLLNPQV